METPRTNKARIELNNLIRRTQDDTMAEVTAWNFAEVLEIELRRTQFLLKSLKKAWAEGGTYCDYTLD